MHKLILIMVVVAGLMAPTGTALADWGWNSGSNYDPYTNYCYNHYCY